MGLGDDIMITGIAKKEKLKHPNKQIIIGNLEEKKAYHSIVYDNNPNITNINKIDKSTPIHFINYHPYNRPYIDYVNSRKDNWKWNMDFSPTPGELFFSEKEKIESSKIVENAILFWNKNNSKKFKGIIFFENTSTKLKSNQFAIKHLNKSWNEKKWLKLINLLKDEYLLIQSNHGESKKLQGVFYANDKFGFRTACSILEKCDLYLGPEGGFSHAAAALKKRAVVYFGGWIHPKVTGYKFHENIYFNHSESPCGAMTYKCKHCKLASDSIDVKFLYNKVIDQI